MGFRPFLTAQILSWSTSAEARISRPMILVRRANIGHIEVLMKAIRPETATWPAPPQSGQDPRVRTWLARPCDRVARRLTRLVQSLLRDYRLRPQDGRMSIFLRLAVSSSNVRASMQRGAPEFTMDSGRFRSQPKTSCSVCPMPQDQGWRKAGRLVRKDTIGAKLIPSE